MEKQTSIVRIKRQNGRITQDCDIYIGRANFLGGWNLKKSIWANPFKVKDYNSNEEACRLYEEYIRKNDELMSRLGELEGKVLGCWCKPMACHGDVLIKLLNERKKK